jgi:hypothetical protein
LAAKSFTNLFGQLLGPCARKDFCGRLHWLKCISRDFFGRRRYTLTAIQAAGSLKLIS